jgi:hypothetical protein
LRLIALVLALAWTGYVLRESWRSGELSLKGGAILAGCFILVSVLAYQSRGYVSDDVPATCGSGPTSYEC